MRHWKPVAIFLLFVFAFAVVPAGGCSTKPAPKPLPDSPGQQATPMPSRMVIGYYENPWPGTPDQTGSFPSMKAFAKHMSHVAPFWYKAAADGTLETRESQLVYDTARQAGLKIFPLITYKTGAIDTILSDPALRTKTINNIVKVAREKPYDGVNIDFEQLKPEQKDNLIAFMAELYPKLKALNKTVIVSVFPKIDVHESVHGAYDYGALAKNADFIQVMLYDRHWATSEPGAIAPIDWYEKNLKYAIEQAGGPHKVIAGVSAYGYDWPAEKGKAAETIKYVDAIVLAEKYGAKILYDEAVQAPHFKYKDHEVWFENDRSTAAKLDVVAKYNPAGIAIWRLGQEQPEIWPLIDKKFPKGQH
ncbi:Spore germination protein YaaH [Sporolituus thermophilus DSM 23256]|uniref:Spore germination protein YaaH n=1 Tax=Sporolituus thermophilus DSM 23256 TaxID=1123285 RepID=A0A1G7N0B4_9FIRM|nr:Spore germination protein YaaH [Sporolituus thermophilus DSM 23256]